LIGYEVFLQYFEIAHKEFVPDFGVRGFFYIKKLLFSNSATKQAGNIPENICYSAFNQR
jgi:hypothetical protein